MATHSVFWVSVVGLLLTVSAAGAADRTYVEGYKPTDKEVSYIAETQAYVKGRIRNPSATRFRYMYVNRKRRLGYPVVCGQINTENGSDDESGWQRFVATPIGDHISFERRLSPHAFNKVWLKICR